MICLAFLPFAVFGGPITLLCIGEGGHFAIETGSGSSCEAASTSSDSDDHGHHDHLDEVSHPSHFGHCHNHEESCGDCVDLELELDDLTSLLSTVNTDFLPVELDFPRPHFLLPQSWSSVHSTIDNRGPPCLPRVVWLDSSSHLNLSVLVILGRG